MYDANCVFLSYFFKSLRSMRKLSIFCCLLKLDHKVFIGMKRSFGVTTEPAKMKRSDEKGHSAFKAAFKKYKSRTKAPDFNNILDPRNISEKWKHSVSAYALNCSVQNIDLQNLGLKSLDTLSALSFTDRPGLIIMPNVLEKEAVFDWIIRCVKEYPQPPNVTNLDSFLSEEEKGKPWELDSLAKLRWATLGYHYDWTEKVYKESARTPIPPELVRLSRTISRILGFPDFTPEAVIANYYHKNSTLSGHVDKAEWNLKAPLISISLGNTAIYLQGGKTLEEEPLPILLRSGDILVMHEGQRLVYHGVPKILRDPDYDRTKSEFLAFADAKTISERDRGIIADFLEYGRINLTVRQMK